MLKGFIGGLCASALLIFIYHSGRERAASDALDLYKVIEASEIIEENLFTYNLYPVVCDDQEIRDAVILIERHHRGQESANDLNYALVQFCQHSRQECDYDESCA